ncbi:MAG: MltA domain-containing protein [Pseudomonadota bacterium]
MSACADPMLARQDPARFLSTYFKAQEVVKGRKPGGFFTGYFEPEINASRARQPGYDTPIYGRPDSLVMVNLGQFRDDLKGRRIAGTVANGRLTPFEDRAAIEGGALDKRAPVIAWAQDPIDLFFLHIQGSGVLRLVGGGETRIGYAAQNGHAYRAIGRDLIASGAVAPDDMSLDAIDTWLRAHPNEAAALMQRNQSYVFFTDRGEEGPLGSLGTVLPARAAIAVDANEVPLGSLVFVDLTLPHDESRFAQLLLAADTGGAIGGLGRGDIFFGQGERAKAAASALKTPGRFVIFTPKAIASDRDLSS